MLGVRQRRHVALRHEAFFVSRQNRLCRRVFFNRLWNDVYDRWITSNFPCKLTQKSKHNKWLEILAGEDFPLKLLWRTPTKIHRERKRRRQQGNGEAERASLAQRRQRRQHSDHNMYRGIGKVLHYYTASQTDCKRNRWREKTPTSDASKSDEEIRQRLKFTVKIIFFNATVGSNSYMICTLGLRTADSLYTMSNNGFL